jgi:CRISPR/Cas system-associated exonuclease Cas4 (RecB family)
MEDFAEYRDLLANEKTIRLVHTEKTGGEEKLFLYDSSRAEIRAAVLGLLRLHEEEGIAYEDMALSVPGLEHMEGCLMRELRLYNIPARRRSGKALAEYGAGNIFSLINSCVANNFSFTAFKALLLDGRLPWQDMETNRRLIRSGVENNCVSAYRENGRLVDVWEEALPGGGELGRYYRNLKRQLSSLAAARSFTELRVRFFSLYPAYLSREKSSAEAAAVLTRCMEELAGLIQLAQEYPDLVPASPFAFYLALLKEKQYVPATQEGGVNVFRYRVAAAAPFAVHFILNAGQDAATVLYQPLGFLRQDKRARLGLGDTDASEDFFRLYRQDPPEGKAVLRVSASEKTFAGWAIPHSGFSGKTVRADNPAGDPFVQEKAWWAGAEGKFPGRLFPVQKQGFASWLGVLASRGKERFDFLSRAFGADSVFLEERIKHIQWNVCLDDALDRKKRNARGKDSPDKKYLRLSATDLNEFYTCPAFWLFRKIFSIPVFSLEAKLLDDASLGNLYHRILEKLFVKIRKEDGAFFPDHLKQYFSLLRACTEEEVRAHPAFQGPLAVPLMVSQAGAITRRLQRLLEAEAEKFPGYAVSDCIEKYLGFVKGDMIFVGKIDRVSVSPGGGPIVVDYKTGATPTGAASRESPASPLRDFQMAMYVKLYEEEKQLPVENGYFASIHGRAILGVFEGPTKEDPRGGREKYQATLEAFEKYAEGFARAVKEMDFTARGVPFKTCAACDYKTICRSAYTLNLPRPGEEARAP